MASCEVGAWDIYLGVGLGSNRVIARDRAIVQALYLLSSGRLSILSSVAKRSAMWEKSLLADHLD